MPRYRSLDGLRGLAAVVVVVHHCLLTSKALAATYRGGGSSGWGLAEILTRTPLHIIWDGTGAVLVFFVLSGFVLTLAATQATDRGWSSYYVRRLPRLYLPVWASLALAVAVAAAVPRVASESQSWWVNAHASPARVSVVVKDASLLWNSSLLNSPLWSLRWEVAFSLLLPVYVLVAMRWRSMALVKVCAALVLVGVGSKTGHAALLYLPVFFLGAVLAAEKDRLDAALSHRAGRFWWAMGGAAALLLTLDSMVGGLPEWITRPLRSLGAAFVVLIFLKSRQVAKCAGSNVVQWLGRISFSLYLVHEPIVVSVDRLVPGINGFEVVLVALPASFLLAAAFYRLVEAPSLAVSRWLGRVEAGPSGFWVSNNAQV